MLIIGVLILVSENSSKLATLAKGEGVTQCLLGATTTQQWVHVTNPHYKAETTR
jgi:hypothetical protein